MLTGLSIKDFVLIDQLDLIPGQGLTVLTGETGAGKSILLDALGAATGARSESGAIRAGADKASITAEYKLGPAHPALAILRENELEVDDNQLILRRTLHTDGRSKAFVNDQPVSVGLLRTLGATLLEVHGQFDTHGLLDASTHQDALDRFAGSDLAQIRQSWQHWQQALAAEEAARAELSKAKAEEEWLTNAVDELGKLAPQPGEEAQLLESKQLLQHREKLMEGLQTALDALSSEQGAEIALATASRALGKIADKAGSRAADALAQLDIARDAVAEAQSAITALSDDMDEHGRSLEQVEDRLYALRGCARRHHCTPEELPQLAEQLSERLRLLSHSDDALGKLAKATLTAQAAYDAAARELTAKRQKAATRLDKAVAGELAPLKLERATFTTQITATTPGQSGADAVQFMISTNPGQPAGPLNKIASGGELARFMLALKVVLAESSDAVTLIFDEVDQGVGGAVAAAVGERLARLAKKVQILVVTHSPQVAAKGHTHWKVEKAVTGQGTSTTTRTSVAVLSDKERKEELARMLAGETITDASRKAAAALLKDAVA